MAAAKPKKIWDNCKFVGEVKKSASTKLRIELVARDGVKYVNIRDWYMTKKEQEWKPGIAGFAVPIALPIDGSTQDVARQLLNIVSEAIGQAADFKLDDPDHAVWAQPKAK